MLEILYKWPIRLTYPNGSMITKCISITVMQQCLNAKTDFKKNVFNKLQWSEMWKCPHPNYYLYNCYEEKLLKGWKVWLGWKILYMKLTKISKPWSFFFFLGKIWRSVWKVWEEIKRLNNGQDYMLYVISKLYFIVVLCSAMVAVWQFAEWPNFFFFVYSK